MEKIRLPEKTNEQVKSYVRAVQAGEKTYHLMPNADKWIVKKLMAKTAKGVFGTRKEAESFAVKVAKKDKAELIIHGQDGLIEDRRSY